MKGYVTDIESATLQNSDYRRVLFTGSNTQLVLMSIPPGEEIGLESHEEHHQFIRVESGVEQGGLIQVEGDIRKGQKVVVLGNERLGPGAPVTIVRELPPGEALEPGATASK